VLILTLDNCIIIRDSKENIDELQKLNQNETTTNLLSELIESIIENDIIENTELVLTMRKYLWNEINSIDDDIISELLLGTIICWQKKVITEVDFRVFWNKYISIDLLDNDNIVTLAILFHNTGMEFEDWMEINIQLSKTLGSLIPSIEAVINTFKEISEIVIHDKWYRINRMIQTMDQRPEYLAELLNNSTNEEIISLLEWIEWDKRQLILEYLVNSTLNEIPQHQLDAYIENISITGYHGDFPLSHNVLGNRIIELPTQTLDEDKVKHIPTNMMKDWLPKFVYSSPEIEEKIKIMFPGGEGIGHSSILMKTNHGLFLFDFGMSVVDTSTPTWHPLFEKLDAVFISHAHLDHSGSLPLLMGNNRNLPWFATSETQIMSEMLWYDTQRITKKNYSNTVIKNNFKLKSLTNDTNLIQTLKNFNEITIQEPISLLPNVEVTAHHAGHLFGSTGFEINISGKRILYTGDFNSNDTTLFKGANFPTDCDLTIFDGTYYGREEPVQQGTQFPDILKKVKRVIIPAFSMGRSQEILFQLKQIGADKNWKIFVTGMGANLAKKLNLTVGSSGGGKSSGVSLVKTVNEDEFTENTIVIGGQGMLQAGTSRSLFEYTQNDDSTGVVLCGYQAPNTMGYHLLNNNNYLKSKYNQQLFRVKASGHTDTLNLNKYLDRINGKKIIVHSPEGTIDRLKNDEIHIPRGMFTI